MDITLAQTFLTIIDSGSFVAAADILNVTQSTISMRIKHLEEILGRTVFERSRSGIVVTSAGRHFQPHAALMVQIWEQARHEISLPENVQSVFSLGGQFSLWDSLLLRWIPWMRTHLPEIAIRTEVGLSEGLMRQLLNGHIDLAVLYTPQNRIGVMIEELMVEHLILVSTNPDTEDISGPDYIYVDWGPEFSQSHRQAFPVVDTAFVSIAYGHLALQYILENGGTGYFPLRMTRSHLDSGALHQITAAPDFKRPVYMAYLEKSVDENFDIALDGLRQMAAQTMDQ